MVIPHDIAEKMKPKCLQFVDIDCACCMCLERWASPVSYKNVVFKLGAHQSNGYDPEQHVFTLNYSEVFVSHIGCTAIVKLITAHYR